MVCVFLTLDLNRMYTLFDRAQDALLLVRDCLFHHIKSLGLELVKDTEMLKEPITFAQRLLDMRDKFEKIVVQGFNSDKAFQKVLKEV